MCVSSHSNLPNKTSFTFFFFFFTSAYLLLWRWADTLGQAYNLAFESEWKIFQGKAWECLRNCSKNRVPQPVSPSTPGHPTLAVTQGLEPASLSLNNTYWFLLPSTDTVQWECVSYGALHRYELGVKRRCRNANGFMLYKHTRQDSVYVTFNAACSVKGSSCFVPVPWGPAVVISHKN